MKYAVLMGTLSVAIVAGATLVDAQGNGTGQMGQKGPKFNFEEVDTNGDGLMTQDEMAAFHKARYEKMDQNGDKMISADEMRTAMQAQANARIEKRITRMMERHDANGDGLVGPDELKPPRADKMLKRVDTDGDGAISRAEFDAMKDRRGKNKNKGG